VLFFCIAPTTLLYRLKVACGAFSGHYFGLRQQKAWFLLAALGSDVVA
jgi:hypothetical protein